MEIADIDRRRRIVRNYTDEPVDSDSVERIIDAAVRTPSAGFSQGQRFVVVTDPVLKWEVAAAGGETQYVAD